MSPHIPKGVLGGVCLAVSVDKWAEVFALPSSVDWKLFDLPVWGPELNWPGTQLYQMSQLEQGPPR